MAREKKAKNGRKGRKFLIILLVLLAFGVYGNMTDEESSQTVSTPTATEASEATSTLSPTTTPEPTEEPASTPEPIATATPIPENPTLMFGDLVSVNKNTIDGIVVIKAKIRSSWDNEATINQNYHNISILAKEGWYSEFNELQYWAVADMTSGSEDKVISFTVSRSVLNDLVADKIAATQLGSYVTDLWIHPSLKK